jgi:hypothetical protein
MSAGDKRVQCELCAETYYVQLGHNCKAKETVWRTTWRTEEQREIEKLRKQIDILIEVVMRDYSEAWEKLSKL